MIWIWKFELTIIENWAFVIERSSFWQDFSNQICRFLKNSISLANQKIDILKASFWLVKLCHCQCAKKTVTSKIARPRPCRVHNGKFQGHLHFPCPQALCTVGNVILNSASFKVGCFPKPYSLNPATFHEAESIISFSTVFQPQGCHQRLIFLRAFTFLFATTSKTLIWNAMVLKMHGKPSNKWWHVI